MVIFILVGVRNTVKEELLIFSRVAFPNSIYGNFSFYGLRELLPERNYVIFIL